MSDDLSDLKKTPIAPERDRVHLPTVKDEAALPDVDEAFGGSGEAATEPIDPSALRRLVTTVLRGIHDPEIPVNIYDLGLIYDLDVSGDGEVEIAMTLTAPACPVAGEIVRQVADAVGNLEGVSRSHVRLVWDPPWSRDRMSEEAKLELGLL